MDKPTCVLHVSIQYTKCGFLTSTVDMKSLKPFESLETNEEKHCINSWLTPHLAVWWSPFFCDGSAPLKGGHQDCCTISVSSFVVVLTLPIAESQTSGLPIHCSTAQGEWVSSMAESSNYPCKPTNSNLRATFHPRTSTKNFATWALPYETWHSKHFFQSVLVVFKNAHVSI